MATVFYTITCSFYDTLRSNYHSKDSIDVVLNAWHFIYRQTFYKTHWHRRLCPKKLFESRRCIYRCYWCLHRRRRSADTKAAAFSTIRRSVSCGVDRMRSASNTRRRGSRGRIDGTQVSTPSHCGKIFRNKRRISAETREPCPNHKPKMRKRKWWIKTPI